MTFNYIIQFFQLGIYQVTIIPRNVLFVYILIIQYYFTTCKMFNNKSIKYYHLIRYNNNVIMGTNK